MTHNLRRSGGSNINHPGSTFSFLAIRFTFSGVGQVVPRLQAKSVWAEIPRYREYAAIESTWSGRTLHNLLKKFDILPSACRTLPVSRSSR